MLGTISASLLCGLGSYGVYKLSKAVDYISEKFHLKSNEYYDSDIISATLTLGIIAMAPRPFKEGTKKAIDKFVFLMESCLTKYDILADHSYYEDIDNVPNTEKFDSNQLTPVGTNNDNKENYIE